MASLTCKPPVGEETVANVNPATWQYSYAVAPQHFLCLRPEPQAHRSLGFCFLGAEFATPPRETTLRTFLAAASDAETVATLCSRSTAARNICSFPPALSIGGCSALLLRTVWGQTSRSHTRARAQADAASVVQTERQNNTHGTQTTTIPRTLLGSEE